MPFQVERPAIDRFLEKVDTQEYAACWNWMACINKAGYGRFQFENKPWIAHRWSYFYFVGQIPPGFDVAHMCNNPSCVNPIHLKALKKEDHYKLDQKLLSIAGKKARLNSKKDVTTPKGVFISGNYFVAHHRPPFSKVNLKGPSRDTIDEALKDLEILKTAPLETTHGATFISLVTGEPIINRRKKGQYYSSRY